MNRIGFAFSLMLFLLVAGCSNKPYVVTDYLSDYDFSALKTFSIVETKQNIKENILISPFTFSHIESVLGRELSQRYQESGSSSTADFVVNYHIVIEEKLDPGTYDRMYGYGFYGRGYRYHPSPFFYGTTGSPRVYNQGSLIIDIVDGKTSKPIWRGVSEKRLRNGLTPQEQREILTGSVIEILAKFPPI